MRVAILGAGVIGVTTAYYLARAGHEVVVLDRQPGPARETSFANAGEISPGYASPWAAPGIPVKALKWLLMRHAPLAFRPELDAAMVRWVAAFLGNCTAARYAQNKARMVRLAEYSRDVLQALRAETGIAYDEAALGTLQLFRTARQCDAAHKDIAVLAASGVRHELLDRSECIAVEPGLAESPTAIAGGLRLPGDETGDCLLFTQRLAALAEQLGVTFHYNTDILGLHAVGGAIDHARTSTGVFKADCYVAALGSHTPALLRPLGIRLPVYPVKGYSLTLPVSNPATAPVSTLLDETYKVAITRLGSRIRVGGMAEICGFDRSLPQRRQATLLHSLQSLFPITGVPQDVGFWAGHRPMTPDGPPIIGPTPLAGLYLNTGHGTLGWTMACGAARVIADLVSGRQADIEASDLGLGRYS